MVPRSMSLPVPHASSAGPFSVLHPDARLAADVIVGAYVVIEANVSVQSGSSLGAGCFIAAGTQLGKGVHVDAQVAFAAALAGTAPALVEDGVWIGAHATIRAGVTIGAGAVIRPGAVVTRSVPAAGIVEGNPATLAGYLNASGTSTAIATTVGPSVAGVQPTGVRGVNVYRLPVIPDMRGTLTVGEFQTNIPFVPLRYFMVYETPSRELRGEHAHRTCHQFLICVRGSCTVMADDGTQRVEISLDAPNLGVYLPPMVWGVQYKHSHDALLLVFASHHYDPADYIRDYSSFLEALRVEGVRR